MLTEIPAIETRFAKGDFDRLIAKIANREDRSLYEQSYRKIGKGDNISYELIGGLPSDIRWRLWDIYIRAYPDVLGGLFSDKLVAYYFYLYRQQIGRVADSVDDFFKASYLNYLFTYFGQKRTRPVPPLNEGDEKLKEMMDMVYNIYDRAYFHKQEHPGCSDLDCFVEAERYYCREKALDHFAFLEYLNRREKGLSGDEHSDYEAANKHYEAWRKNIGMGAGIDYGCASAC
jgi:hypothetical protein